MGAGGGGVRIGMLGPFEVRDDSGRPITVGGARLRALLALLALNAGRVVTVDQLVDGLWGATPPTGAANALQSLVSRLRRSFPDTDLVRSSPAGYLLDLAPDRVDTHLFAQLSEAGRTALAAGRGGVGTGRTGGAPEPAEVASAAEAAEKLSEALALWRGPALADVAAPFASAVVTRLEGDRLATVEDLGDAWLAAGRPADALAVLAGPADDHPLRERLCGLTVRALCAAGRQADALARYETTRRALADDLGVDPSPELGAIHLAALRGELTEPVKPASTPESEAPARTARTNLRAAVSSFIGREREVRELRKMLADTRLVTLVGPGGTGKTRLASEASAGLVDRTPDGVWLAELAPVSDPVDVPYAVLAALGSPELRLVTATAKPGSAAPAGPDPTERLVAALAERRLLLVLDNCEHLVDAAARLADTVLAACPGVTVLATSRSALGITGETLYPVPALELPADGAGPAEAGGTSAVRLLTDRAVAVRPGFAVTGGNVTAVSQICRRLDGAPLALELAAARLRTLDADQVAARLDDRFQLLTGGSRTALPRHQTLRAVVEWSWDLLDDAGRALARRLSVFAGGATLEAVEAVCTAGAGLPPEAVLPALSELVDQSLVEPTGDGPVRYRMLETIRAYAGERLAEAGETDLLRRAHADYFLRLAEAAEPVLRTGEQLGAMDRLRAEHDNVLAALRWSIDANELALALRICASLLWYWFLLGYSSDAGFWATEVMRVAPDEPPPGMAPEYAACWLAAQLVTVGELVQEGQEDAMGAIMERFGDLHRAAVAERRPHPMLTAARAATLVFSGRIDETQQVITEALDDPDPWVRAGAHLFRAVIGQNVGHFADLGADFEAAVDGYRAIGERWGLSLALVSLGEYLVAVGDYGRAAAALAEAWGIASKFFTEKERPGFLIRLAGIRARAGDLDTAEANLAEARAMMAGRSHTDHEQDFHLRMVEGDVLRRRGRYPEARVVYEDLLVAAADRPRGFPQLKASTQAALARLDLADGKVAEAAGQLHEALVALAPSHDIPVLVNLLDVLVLIEAAGGRPAEVVRLGAAGRALRGGVGSTDPAVRDALGAARAALPAAEADAADADGAAMDFVGVYRHFDLEVPDRWPRTGT
jgi:predicted ATPase/DNA-binding SARP family transcriptional activator